MEFYSLYDDTTQAAVDAYENNTLESYVENLPAEVWVHTEATNRVIYLLTPAGDTTQHILFIRCTDDDGAVSEVKARAFFRSNEPPNRPMLSVLPDEDYYHEIDRLTDTLLMGETLTQTYGGVQILWTGNDPDDRALVTIPLEFSFLIVREPGDTIHFPGDTIQADKWSKWSATKMKTLYGLETGAYTFYLKSRDDGLTECAQPAWAKFHFIKPTFEHHLLIVDENGTRGEGAGWVNPDSVMAFHKENWEQAWAIMNQIYPDSHFADDGVDLQVWVNRDVTGNVRIPCALIHQFQLVWIIDDDRQRLGDMGIPTRVKVMTDYLDVGGMLMLSGRMIFVGSYGIPTGVQQFNSTEGQIFFRDYFNISEGFANRWEDFRNQPEGTDFGRGIGALFGYPDIEVDTAKVHALRFGASRYYCLPDIDWIGRNRETMTIYYYYSCTADNPYEVVGYDCQVIDSTAYYCKLMPTGYDDLISVTRIYNKTKNVYGQFMYFTDNNSTFMVSTPAWAGAWGDADTLEVDFTYIPVSDNHLKPVATVYENWEGINDYEAFTYTAQLRFRTSLVSFPLYFIKNDIRDTEVGPLPVVVELLVRQFIFFYSQRSFVYHWGG
ncbi:MAG: hypothetical protein V1784_07535 [bacterium]